MYTPWLLNKNKIQLSSIFSPKFIHLELWSRPKPSTTLERLKNLFNELKCCAKALIQSEATLLCLHPGFQQELRLQIRTQLYVDPDSNIR